MTTELDIHTLARRLREAYPGRYTALSMDADNHSSGNNTITWNAYRANDRVKYGLGDVSPEFPTLAELAEWLEANWLKEVQS